MPAWKYWSGYRLGKITYWHTKKAKIMTYTGIQKKKKAEKDTHKMPATLGHIFINTDQWF